MKTAEQKRLEAVLRQMQSEENAEKEKGNNYETKPTVRNFLSNTMAKLGQLSRTTVFAQFPNWKKYL
jgi:hypothetical protein